MIISRVQVGGFIGLVMGGAAGWWAASAGLPLWLTLIKLIGGWVVATAIACLFDNPNRTNRTTNNEEQ